MGRLFQPAFIPCISAEQRKRPDIPVMARAFPFARLTVHGRRPWAGARIHERQLRAGARIHGRRPRVGRHGERTPPAAHTLTPTLLPTTCVVVNKLVGLTLSDNRGCAPPVRKCLPPTVKSPQEAPPPHAASQVRGIAASTEGAGWADRRYRVLVAARHPLPAPLHRCGHGGFDSGQAERGFVGQISVRFLTACWAKR